MCSIYKENFCFSVPLPPSTQWSNVTWHAVQTDFKNTNQAVISRKSRVLKLGYKKVCDINANLVYDYRIKRDDIRKFSTYEQKQTDFWENRVT